MSNVKYFSHTDARYDAAYTSSNLEDVMKEADEAGSTRFAAKMEDGSFAQIFKEDGQWLTLNADQERVQAKDYFSGDRELEQPEKLSVSEQKIQDVMEKFGLRSNAERDEYLEARIDNARQNLSKAGLDELHKTDVNNTYKALGLPVPYPDHEAAQDAYILCRNAGSAGAEIPSVARENPALLQGYIKGLEDHVTDMQISRDIDGVYVPQSSFDRANQLMVVAAAVHDKLTPSLKQQNLEVKSDGPELGR